MEKKALLAVVLSLLVLFLYQYYVGKGRETSIDKTTPQNSVAEVEKERFTDPAQKEESLFEVNAKKSPVGVKEQGVEKEISITTDLYTAVFTTRGAKLKSWRLKKYKDKIGEDSQDIELIMAGGSEEFPMGVGFSKSVTHGIRDALFNASKDYLSLTGIGEQDSISFSWTSPEGIEVVKEFTFYDGKYLVDLDVSLLNLSNRDIKEEIVLSWKARPGTSEKANRFSFSGPVALVNGELEEVKVDKLDEERTYRGGVKWAGYEDKYFISSIIPAEFENVNLRMSKPSTDIVSVDIIKSIDLRHGEKASYRYTFYSGPKDLDRLKSAGSDLQKALNFGWFDVIAKPLLIFLKYINEFTHNYGVAIILLTVVIKILFFPLTHKSYKSMKDMQKVQPLMLKIREKYKNDRETLNKETMALYRTHKVNPLGGCLPMILQIPVFFALYKALLGSIELRHAPFLLWINDLSAKDPYYITPIVMGATMFIQQKMTPTVGDPTQAKMMLLMPIVFTFMFLNFPSGLVIYWLVNNVLSIGQQLYINKYAA